eukprot:COSAG03_NODE_4288_length_1606_cov_1.573324_1_plen_153_part_00
MCAEQVATGVMELNFDPALSDIIMKAEGPSVCVVGWNVSDETVQQLATLPYEEWKEEMRARKQQAEAEANAAAAVVPRPEAAHVHFSRRGEPPRPQKAVHAASKPKPQRAADADRWLARATTAECTFRPRTGIPKAVARMRLVLDAPDDQLV